MVLSSDLSLITIRNALENGINLDVYQLPRRQRESLLKLVLMHGTINRPTCLSALSSTEFLNGFKELNTQSGNAEDQRYLDLIVKSMSEILPDGTMIGDGIKKLELNLYGYMYKQKDGQQTMYDANIWSVIDLIGKCPNLSILNLRLSTVLSIVEENENEKYEDGGSLCAFECEANEGGLLNCLQELEPCLSMMENLEEISLTGIWRRTLTIGTEFKHDDPTKCDLVPFLTDLYPVIEFKRLKKLIMADTWIHEDSWLTLLQSVQNTLEYLQLNNVGLYLGDQEDDENRRILPIPLSNLKHLELSGVPFRDSYTNQNFLENLIRCSNLKFIQFGDLNEQSKNMENLAATLDQITNAVIKIDLHIYVSDMIGNNFLFDDQSRFKLINLFGNKITSFSVFMLRFHSRLASAIEHALKTSQNFTSLSLSLLPVPFLGLDENEKIESALLSFFSDKKRASLIRRLKINRVDMSSDVLKLIFENCTNLDSISISSNSHLNDINLIEWANRDPKLSSIWIEDCANITDGAMVPIIVNSADRLKTFVLKCDKQVSRPSFYDGSWHAVIEHCRNNIYDRSWRAVIEHCRYIQEANIPDRYKDLFYVYKMNLINEEPTYEGFIGTIKSYYNTLFEIALKNNKIDFFKLQWRDLMSLFS